MKRRQSYRRKADPLEKLACDFHRKNKKKDDSEENGNNQSSQTRFKKTNRYKLSGSAKSGKEKKTETPAGIGAVYIGNLPHGFYEKQLYSYFKQFGWIYKIKVAHSPKNAKPMGYAHVVFYDHHVARIVANTMDTYFMYNKVLRCKFVSGNMIPKDVFEKNFTFKNCPLTLNRLKEQSKMLKDHPNFTTKMDNKLLKNLKVLTSQIGMKLSENEVEVNEGFKKTKQFQEAISNPPKEEAPSSVQSPRPKKTNKLKELIQKKQTLSRALKRNNQKKVANTSKRTKTGSKSLRNTKKRPKSDRRLNARKR